MVPYDGDFGENITLDNCLAMNKSLIVAYTEEQGGKVIYQTPKIQVKKKEKEKSDSF